MRCGQMTTTRMRAYAVVRHQEEKPLSAMNSYSVAMPEESHSGLHHYENPTLNADFNLVRSDYRVRLAGERSSLHAKASKLVSSMYSSHGLGTTASTLSTIPPHKGRSERLTLVASRGSDVLGTLTLRIDPGNELLADSLYHPELDALRTQGKRLCEVTRLALHPQLGCREVMATLFQITFILASAIHQRTDMLAEVHPRHARFYGRTLGYKVVGPERICQRVGAPAVLMHLCLEYAKDQIMERAGTCCQGNRDLYSLFLPPAEQEGMLKKLTACWG